MEINDERPKSTHAHTHTKESSTHLLCDGATSREGDPSSVGSDASQRTRAYLGRITFRLLFPEKEEKHPAEFSLLGSFEMMTPPQSRKSGIITL